MRLGNLINWRIRKNYYQCGRLEKDKAWIISL